MTRINLLVYWLWLFLMSLLLAAALLIPAASRAEAPRLGVVLLTARPCPDGPIAPQPAPGLIPPSPRPGSLNK